VTEAIAAGRHRDMDELLRTGVGLFQRLEEERRGFVASLQVAEAETDRVGCVSLDQGGRRHAQGDPRGRPAGRATPDFLAPSAEADLYAAVTWLARENAAAADGLREAA
jgi:hypothetical protein